MKEIEVSDVMTSDGGNGRKKSITPTHKWGKGRKMMMLLGTRY